MTTSQTSQNFCYYAYLFGGTPTVLIRTAAAEILWKN
jgi:hypothetical protein